MLQPRFLSLLLAGLLVPCLSSPVNSQVGGAEENGNPPAEQATPAIPPATEELGEVGPSPDLPAEEPTLPEEGGIQEERVIPEEGAPEQTVTPEEATVDGSTPEPGEASTPLPPEVPAPPVPEEIPAVREAEEPIIRQNEDGPVVVAPRKRTRARATARRATGNERVEIGRSVVVGRDEVVGELVVIAGDATVDGTVDGSVVVITGSARINGRVRQDLVTVLGSATLGPKGRVGHDAVVVGGTLTVPETAAIGGQQTVVALGPMVPDLLWLQRWVSNGLFLARPFPPGVKWVWGVAALCLLLYIALAVIFPRSVRTCVDTLERQPIASFFIGVLVFVLLGPLLFLLVVSVAGILVIPFLICAVIAAVIFGKVAVYTFAGLQVGRQMNRPEVSMPLVLILGAILFYLIYMVPLLGFAVWGVVTLVGVGAVLLAAFGSFRQETAPAYALAATNPSEMALAPVGPVAGGSVLPSMPPLLTAGDAALLPRVGFWRRFTATFLDFVLLALLMPFTGPMFVLVWAGYHFAMWAWKGTTIGGIVMNIKVVRLDGQPIDLAVAMVRCLSSFFSAIALFLGFFWAGWDAERQAWHDKIAGTIVVKVPKGISLI